MIEKQNEPYDDRADSYKYIGGFAAYIAEDHSRVDMDDLTRERWRQLMALMREVDTLADDEWLSKENLVEELRSFDIFSDRYPALAPDAVGDTSHGAMLLRAEKLFDLGASAASETSVRKFTALRIAEGRETANLLIDSATRHTLSQDSFHDNFMPTIRSLGIAATLLDSIMDAHVDRRAGKVAVEITPEYYGVLTGELFRRGQLGSAALFHASTMRELGSMYSSRIKNRAKNGAKPYSSLAIFRSK